MNISVYFTSNDVTAEGLAGRNSAVIDVLRATSVIVTAIENGAKGVAAFKTIEEAVRYKKLAGEQILLGGERNAVKIDGFNFGNSPLEYTKEAVENQFIALTTTNGTKAIEKCKGAKNLYIMSFLNIDAVCQHIVNEGLDAAIVCSGTAGRFSLDDALCAGMAVSVICGKNPNCVLDDAAFFAKNYYEKAGKNIKKLIKDSSHYQSLLKIGFEEDGEYCTRENIFNIIPFYDNGLIVKR